MVDPEINGLQLKKAEISASKTYTQLGMNARQAKRTLKR